MEAVEGNSNERGDESDRPKKRIRTDPSFVAPTTPLIPYDTEQAYNSRIVVSQSHWVHRHYSDIVDVIRWLVESSLRTEEEIEQFLLDDNSTREKVDMSLRNRITDPYGSRYALRFSTKLENLHHRHQHDLLRLLNHLVANDASLLAKVEGKLQSFSKAQSEIRKKLRE
jgi:hypothetical protein